jgi:hypothetical protein
VGAHSEDEGWPCHHPYHSQHGGSGYLIEERREGEEENNNILSIYL